MFSALIATKESGRGPSWESRRTLPTNKEYLPSHPEVIGILKDMMKIP